MMNYNANKVSFHALETGDTVYWLGMPFKILQVYNDGSLVVKDNESGEHLTLTYDELD